ncbi:Mitochondrial peroxiredoxin PRX1 [Thelohanellus kitauei]|uniref:thioredoxin-dependent peroxiredoxin n=1 Tax=Thelohanellus kitauei TaxID=669202 RepID=A0A0C2MX55_THEKT|nr:Mitochondrial peroxiredoxin PRX1 [Thelohanellus kitauei]
MIIGTTFPDFKVKSTIGELEFYKWADKSWVMLFSHPFDFTPVCTTELAEFSKRRKEFEDLGVKLLGLSVGTAEDHLKWSQDICHYAGTKDLGFPIVEGTHELIKMLCMTEIDTQHEGPIFSARTVYFISPTKELRAYLAYPASTGRSIDELLRVMKSLQLFHKHSYLATPVDWQVTYKYIAIRKSNGPTSRFRRGRQEVLQRRNQDTRCSFREEVSTDGRSAVT